MILRIAWTTHVTNKNLAIAASVFINAGVMLIVDPPFSELIIVRRQSDIPASAYTSTLPVHSNAPETPFQSFLVSLHVEYHSTDGPRRRVGSTTLPRHRPQRNLHRPRHPPLRTMLPHSLRHNSSPRRHNSMDNMVLPEPEIIQSHRSRSHHSSRRNSVRGIAVVVDPSTENMSDVLYTKCTDGNISAVVFEATGAVCWVLFTRVVVYHDLCSHEYTDTVLVSEKRGAEGGRK
jgi:hypothetical protein